MAKLNIQALEQSKHLVKRQQSTMLIKKVVTFVNPSTNTKETTDSIITADEAQQCVGLDNTSVFGLVSPDCSQEALVGFIESELQPLGLETAYIKQCDTDKKYHMFLISKS
jgi:quinolinate synthase